MATAPGAVDVDVSLNFSSAGDVTRSVTIGDQTLTQTRSHPESASVTGDGFADWWSAYIRGPRQRPERDVDTLRFIDLFSSVGGLSLGAMEAISSIGLRGQSLLATDVDAGALEVYKANLRPRHTTQYSVAGMVDFQVTEPGAGARFAYVPRVTDERLAGIEGQVDMILAGPPCQGHSSLNNHTRHQDMKNLLYLTVPAIAIAVGARHVVIENVPNVVADKHGVVQTTMALLRANGYHLTFGVIAANRLGWPQTRHRFFLVASRDTMPLDIKALEKVMSRDALPVTWALDDLQGRALDDTDVMFSVPQLSEENLSRVKWLFDNDKHTLDDAIRPDCHKNGTTYSATYGRMYPDKPAPTLTGGFLTPGRGRFIHPTQPRVLTPLEAARVQGFPDWYRFDTDPADPPSRQQLSTWIGNAVPTILGYVATLAAIGGEKKAVQTR